MGRNESSSDKAYLIDPKGSRDDLEEGNIVSNGPTGDFPPLYQPTAYQPAVISQPAANQPQTEYVSLCDCNGSYCKYCWLGAFICTFPYVWYKIPKALNMGNLVKVLLASTILYMVFGFLNTPIQYNQFQFRMQMLQQQMDSVQQLPQEPDYDNYYGRQNSQECTPAQTVLDEIPSYDCEVLSTSQMRDSLKNSLSETQINAFGLCPGLTMCGKNLNEILNGYAYDTPALYDYGSQRQDFWSNYIDLPDEYVLTVQVGLLVATITIIVLLTIVRQKFKKVTASEDNCCASCCEVMWCTPCVAGQMGKTFEINKKFDI